MRIYTSAQNTEFTDRSSSILDDLSRKDFVDAYALIHFPKDRPMCGCFALFHDAATLAKYLPVERVAFSPEPRYNIAPTLGGRGRTMPSRRERTDARRAAVGLGSILGQGRSHGKPNYQRASRNRRAETRLSGGV